ncbi:hypothetical protein Dimus_015397 [Dionaea muscipula]
MPTEKINMQGKSVSPASYFAEDAQFTGERQVGFWKSDPLRDPSGMKIDRMSCMPCSMPVSFLPREKIIPVDSQMAKHSEIHETNLIEAQKANLSLLRQAVGADRVASNSWNLWSTVDIGSGVASDYNTQSTSFRKEGDKHSTISAQYENKLFSSSLSEFFDKKLRFSMNNSFYGHSVDTVASPHEVEEPSESLEEIEAQTIGNLLPDDDDLFSGIVYGLEPVAQPREGDDIEDLDLFSSVGGMELGDDNSSGGKRNTELLGGISPGQLGDPDVSIPGQHPCGEHPSRTLFVRNIDSNVEDSELRALFEEYGDIRTLYTACKHRGFVMISYYDLRSARNAMKALQSKPLRHRKLDIHYSIPKDNPFDKDVSHGTLLVFNLDSSISNDDLRQILGIYGEIKEIQEAPSRNKKFIEFYDVRAADAALRALNQTDIAGKRINLEPSRPGGARKSSAQQFPPNVDQDEAGFYVENSPGSFFHGPMTSASMKSEISLGTPSGIQSPFSHQYMENAFCHGISSSVPSSLSSLLRKETGGNQACLSESGPSCNQIKYDFEGMPNFHPLSLPEHPDVLAIGASSHSSTNMAGGVGLLSSGRVDVLSGRISTNGRSSEGSSGFSSSGNGSYPAPRKQYMWNNSSNNVQLPSLMWPNSPSFSNGVSAPHPPSSRVHGLAITTQSPMLKPVVPMSNHHVGSAPTVNHSVWDRRHAHPVGSPDISCFQLGPLGSMRSPLHPMEFVSENVFPHLGGNCMNVNVPIPSGNIGMHSHHYRSSVLHSARSQMNSLASSFEPAANERFRSRRTTESSSSQADNKKQYELDLDRILRGEDNRTTLMIKNIPNKYTSKMLMAAIDERHRGTYDFIYLPIDFKNKCNVGYAFINMIDPRRIIPFYETFNGKKWEKFNSEKVASLAYGRIQGKQALIAHFQNSSLMNEDKRCRPILFHTDGPNAGDQVPFPMGANNRARTSKPRSSNIEDNQREESSIGDSSSGSGKESD